MSPFYVTKVKSTKINSLFYANCHYKQASAVPTAFYDCTEKHLKVFLCGSLYNLSNSFSGTLCLRQNSSMDRLS